MHTQSGECPVCGSATDELFTARVLNRHEVSYLRCAACEFLHTEPPHWLDEAYSSAISSADTGLVARNLRIARQLTCVLGEFFDHDGTYLDFAGGTGILTRMMRDTGFDFRWEDRYSANVVASGFEAPASQSGFEAITAFEAIEHMPDPMAFVREALDRSATRTLIFTTELFRSPTPPQDWWYFAYATGQHISFFTAKTMAEIARSCGVRFYSSGSMHMLTSLNIPEWKYKLVVKGADLGLHRRWARKLTSRIQSDHTEMLRRAQAQPT